MTVTMGQEGGDSDPELEALNTRLASARRFYENKLFVKSIKADIQSAYQIDHPDDPPLAEDRLKELVEAEIAALKKSYLENTKEIEANETEIDPLKIHSFPTTMQLDTAAALIEHELKQIAEDRKETPLPEPVKSYVSGLYLVDDTDPDDHNWYFAVQWEGELKIFYHSDREKGEAARQQISDELAAAESIRENSVHNPSTKHRQSPFGMDPIVVGENTPSIKSFGAVMAEIIEKFELKILADRPSETGAAVEKLKIYDSKYAVVVGKAMGVVKQTPAINALVSQEASLFSFSGAAENINAWSVYGAGRIAIVASFPARIILFIEGYKQYKEAGEAIDKINRDIKEGRIAADSSLTIKKLAVANQLKSEGICNMQIGGVTSAIALGQISSTVTTILTAIKNNPAVGGTGIHALGSVAPGVMLAYSLYTLNQQAQAALDIQHKLQLASAMFDHFSRNFPDPLMPEIPDTLLQTPEGAFLQEQKSLGMELSAYYATKLKQDYESTLKGGAVTILQGAVSANCLVQSSLVKAALIAAGLGAGSIATAGAAMGAVAIAGCVGAMIHYSNNKKLTAERAAQEDLINDYGDEAKTYEGMLRRLYLAVKAEATMASEMAKQQRNLAQSHPKAKTSKFDAAINFAKNTISTHGQTMADLPDNKEHEIGFPTDVVINTHSRYSELLELLGLTPQQFIDAVDNAIDGYEKVNNQKLYKEEWLNQYEGALNNKLHLLKPEDKDKAQKLNVKGNDGKMISITTTNPTFGQRCIVEAMESANQHTLKEGVALNKKETKSVNQFYEKKNAFLSQKLSFCTTLIDAYNAKVVDVIEVLNNSVQQYRKALTDPAYTEKEKTSKPKTAESTLYKIGSAIAEMDPLKNSLKRLGEELKKHYEEVKVSNPSNIEENIKKYQAKEREFNKKYQEIIQKGSNIMHVIQYCTNDVEDKPNKRNLNHLLLKIGVATPAEKLGKRFT